ncbi:MAG: hypothetical protein NXI20_10235 [bacterium]|nr:hypothetical protein [bacterium]
MNQLQNTQRIINEMLPVHLYLLPGSEDFNISWNDYRYNIIYDCWLKFETFVGKSSYDLKETEMLRLHKLSCQLWEIIVPDSKYVHLTREAWELTDEINKLLASMIFFKEQLQE